MPDDDYPHPHILIAVPSRWYSGEVFRQHVITAKLETAGPLLDISQIMRNEELIDAGFRLTLAGLPFINWHSRPWGGPAVIERLADARDRIRSQVCLATAPDAAIIYEQAAARLLGHPMQSGTFYSTHPDWALR